MKILYFCFHALVLSLFLFAFTTTTLANGFSSYLRDVHGQALYNGGLYHIFPVYYTGTGGGLELARTKSERCPRTVAQAVSATSKGLPARLASPAKLLFLKSDLLLSIEFQLQNPITCYRKGSRLRWEVVGRSQIVRVRQVEEEASTSGRFKIQPYRGFYKLVYCKLNGDECRDLGISMDDEGNRRLVVKDGNPLIVSFINAEISGAEYMAEQ